MRRVLHLAARAQQILHQREQRLAGHAQADVRPIAFEPGYTQGVFQHLHVWADAWLAHGQALGRPREVLRFGCDDKDLEAFQVLFGRVTSLIDELID